MVESPTELPAEVPLRVSPGLRRWKHASVLLCAVALSSFAAIGQTTGAIRGEVRDPSGALVPGTILTATLAGTETSRTATTDADGAFEIPELAVGTYTVAAHATGFKNYSESDVVVTIGHVAVVDIALAVGAASDTITVQANATQVETTSTQIGRASCRERVYGTV